MAAVNQNAQANAARAPKIEEAVHGGANRAARIQDIVHNYQVAIIHREIDFRGVDHGRRADGREDVPIKRDVQCSDWNLHLSKGVDDLRKALRERDAPAANADQGEVFRPTALFYKFVSEPLQGAVDFFGRK